MNIEDAVSSAPEANSDTQNHSQNSQSNIVENANSVVASETSSRESDGDNATAPKTTRRAPRATTTRTRAPRATKAAASENNDAPSETATTSKVVTTTEPAPAVSTVETLPARVETRQEGDSTSSTRADFSATSNLQNAMEISRVEETSPTLRASASKIPLISENAEARVTDEIRVPQTPREFLPRDNNQRENAPRDNRQQNQAQQNQPVRGERALRFRGRDGRTEVRARGDNRNDGRSDNRGDNNRNDNRFRNRNEPRQNQNGRDGGGRDNNRDQSGHGRLPRENNRDHERRPNEYDLSALEAMETENLVAVAEDLGIAEAATLAKADLVLRVLEVQAEQSGNLFKQGILEILPDGKGFLRTEGYLSSNEDVYISQSQIKRFNLKTGDIVSGPVRAPKEMERYYGLLRVDACNGEAPDVTKARKEFEKLTPIFPDEKFELETTQENTTARIIDLVSPIGKGQRGLIVAPPKAGKTSLIKNVANSIMANHPDVHLIVLLIDERPEEVTDIARSVRGEVVASTFDEMPENHIRVADMVLEKAKRMVEQKRDVVILLDSITRLSRASNLVVAPSGRTMSGGLDPAAMYKPKRLFGAARNIEEGGSLTILATVLVDTGSRMDEYIFEELKGTGNMDLVLDRNLFDQRIFPAIDVKKSGTRRDDLLLSKEDLAAVYHLRRTLSALDNDKAINLLIDRLKNTKTNEDFMQVVAKSARQQSVQNGNGTSVS